MTEDKPAPLDALVDALRNTSATFDMPDHVVATIMEKDGHFFSYIRDDVNDKAVMVLYSIMQLLKHEREEKNEKEKHKTEK